ncbi:ABC-three component system middle component 2 [Clavibacter michiganensis]|uniref:ABC-three component system middle component 2 n=1 Tax=Clavibacter michiganensis TaxID=28447 RepID=UPI00345C121A
MSLYNTSREVSPRLLNILVAVAPRRVNIDQMIRLDYALVHSSDFGGPTSLFPASKSRLSEITVKGPVIKAGLHRLVKAGLVSLSFTDQGILFSASEEASVYLRLLQGQLAEALREVAFWLAEEAFINDDSSQLSTEFVQRAPKWQEQFEAGA